MPTLLLLLAFRGKGFRSTVFLFFSASWCISLRPICQNTTANRPLQDMSLVLLLAQVPVITKNHPPTASLILFYLSVSCFSLAPLRLSERMLLFSHHSTLITHHCFTFLR
jgi:hypothetical protein